MHVFWVVQSPVFRGSHEAALVSERLMFMKLFNSLGVNSNTATSFLNQSDENSQNEQLVFTPL
jgi:hypothetical protein